MKTCRRYLRPSSFLTGGFASTVLKEAGAPARFAGSISFERIAACGHAITHWLHWMQAAESHFGTDGAIPALLELRGRGRHRTVIGHRGDRDIVALLVQDRLHERIRERAHIFGDERLRLVGRDAVQRSRNFDFLQHGERLIDAGLVFLDDIVALLLELLLDSGLDVADRLVGRNDVGQLEEAGLHDGRNVLRAADFERRASARRSCMTFTCFLHDDFLHFAGEALEDLGRPGVRC